jgi:ABC-type polysaccharide/polyol phosphate transport system ATPase subunit
MARLVADHVSVEFPIYQGTSRSLSHAILLKPIGAVIRGAANVGGAITRGVDGRVVVRALDDVSFTIADGERVGLIGQNGSGKTTLLRVMAGIYEPTGGAMLTSGRIVPFFNLTEGMMPEITGRELIKVRGTLLGFSAEESAAVADEVIEFCELGDYLDMPVRTYSTGMMVRLAFAIATSVTADILLFDELIGAGDEAFYEKAHARLERFVGRSSAMVVATHSRGVLYKWCNRCLLMEHGKLIASGPVDDVLRVYDQRRGKQ